MDLGAWKKKRNKTVITYLLFGTVFGIDNTLIPITIFPYLQELVPKDKATYFYSLSSIMFSICSSVAAIIVGRIVDRTRRVRYSLYFVLTCSMLGEFIYTLRCSPYIVVVARTLCGTLSSEHYILRGEIIRIFDEQEASKVLWWYTAASTVGYIIGSSISLAFDGINFAVGDWKIDATNFAGVFMAGVCLINIVCVNNFTHDCSMEYDLKSFADKEKMDCYQKKNINGSFSQEVADDEETANSARQENHHHISDKTLDVSDATTSNDASGTANTTPYKNIFKILHGFIRSQGIMMIMASTFLYAGAGYTSDLMRPIVVLNMFKWKTKYLNMTSGFTAMGMICTTLILSRYGVTKKQVYSASIVTITMSFVNISVLTVVTLVPTNVNWQIVLFVFYTIASVPMWQLDSVIFPNMLGRMVKTDVQSFAESCRSILSLSSCIIVGIFIAADGYLKYLLFGLAGLTLVSFAIFVYE